jgi:hypothetical protein
MLDPIFTAIQPRFAQVRAAPLTVMTTAALARRRAGDAEPGRGRSAGMRPTDADPQAAGQQMQRGPRARRGDAAIRNKLHSLAVVAAVVVTALAMWAGLGLLIQWLASFGLVAWMLLIGVALAVWVSVRKPSIAIPETDECGVPEGAWVGSAQWAPREHAGFAVLREAVAEATSEEPIVVDTPERRRVHG